MSEDEDSSTGKNGKKPKWKERKKEKKVNRIAADMIDLCGQVGPNVKFQLDIKDEPLDVVVKLIACLTQKNVIITKGLKSAKLTIFSPKLVTSQEAYRAFLTALEANGLTLSRQGNFLRVVDSNKFMKAPDPFLRESATPPNQDQMVTQIVTLKHVDAGEMKDLIANLASDNAQIVPYAPNNSLIITEIGSNLRKLKALMKELDVPGGQEELWIYQIVHAEAQEIAQKILEVFEKEEKGSKKKKKRKSRGKKKKGKASVSASVGESDLQARVSKVIADERTNRLLIVASRRSYRKVKKLIERLDIAVEGDGQVHIHQLNHAKAADVSSVLSNLSNEQRSRGSKKRRKSKKRSKKKKKSSSSSSSSAALFEGEVNVTADEDTNALVITASLKDYLALKKVIDVLDRPRRQVFIEAIVMEVSIDNNRQFGLATHAGYNPSFGGEDGLALMASPAGGSSIIDLTSAASLTGLAVQGPPITVKDQLALFRAILRAVASNNGECVEHNYSDDR